MNLAGNAVKFTSVGEVLIHVAPMEAPENQAGIRVEVRDTGEGIPFEAQERLFEPFTQADAATTRRFGGTGLGLAISRQLVELMHGRIGFESTEGKGSMFWFEIRLPIDAVQPDGTSTRGLSGRRFLVVDDNATNRKVISAQLATMGAEAQCVANAREALAALERSGPFTAVLLDWHMPERDGLSLARELRATGLVGAGRPGSEWLVLLSSAASHALANEDILFDCVLVKPVRLADLQRCLLRLIHGENHEQPAPGTATIAPPATDGNGALHLLLVEDNLSNQRVARMLLERLGHKVDVAADGEVALQMLAANHYDATLMDCQMPVLDGYEATRRIRRGDAPGVERDLCIIALTANAMASDRIKCLDAGMTDFVTKPVRLDDLRHVLARCIKPA
jgi:CheY-like chemotaxis protein